MIESMIYDYNLNIS